MTNSKFKIETIEKVKVIQLFPKIGRNDMCHCNSGKKYKNCCMRKDDEERMLRERLELEEILSDKYFSAKEYISLSGYPVTKYDYFLLEILNVVGGILYKFQKLDASENKEVMINVFTKVKEFYLTCKNCEFKCLETPMKNISFKSLLDKNFEIEELPLILQEPKSINFFYIEFINNIAHEFKEILTKYLEEDIVSEICSVVYWSLIDYVSENCSEQCDNKCVINQNDNDYCSFCSISENKIPCPKSGKISFSEIKAKEEDMIH